MGLTLGKGKTSGNSKARLIGFTRQVETVYSHSSYITRPPRSIFMSNFDEIVGKVKKEVGDTIGNSKLQAEGLIQEGVGKAKEAIADVEKQAADVLEKGKKSAEELMAEAKGKAEGLINDIKSKF
jgi:hypothetical protein